MAVGRGGGLALDWDAPVPPIVNETKLGILTVMRALRRPMTAEELRMIVGRRKCLAVFDYHLSTLARAGVAEFLTDGPRLRFRLVGGTSLPLQPHAYRDWCR